MCQTRTCLTNSPIHPKPFTHTIIQTRTCLMNATAPLMKSILMDHVPKRSRAKWASLDSVTRFG